MRKISRTWIMLLLTLSASLYLLFASMQNSSQQLANEASQQVQQVSQTLRQSKLAVETLANIALQQYRENRLEMQADGGSSTQWPGAHHQSRTTSLIHSDLVGATTQLDSPAMQPEIAMALQLNPHFAKISQDLPEATSLYYTSARQFCNIFASKGPAPDCGSAEHWQAVHIQQGQPKNNPQRLTYWSPVHTAADGKLELVTISTPLYDGETFLGLISLDIAIPTLQQLLRPSHLKQTQVLLVDQSERLLASIPPSTQQSQPQHDLASALPKSLQDTHFRLQDLPPQVPQLVGWFYLYRSPIQGTAWQIYYLRPLPSVICSALQLAAPILLVGLLLMLVLRENKVRKESQHELRRLVSQLQLHQCNLERESKTDPLTHLYNRRGLQEIMDKEITRCKRYRRPCSLILFDIDFFKQINDKYGHDGGDHCLISLAQALRQQLRAQDAMGRWGGEEFLILLPETTQQQALQVADKLRQSIEQNPIRYRQLRIPVSITAGVVEYDLHSELDACIEKADKALYQGKQGGRNRCIAAVQLVSEWQ